MSDYPKEADDRVVWLLTELENQAYRWHFSGSDINALQALVAERDALREWAADARDALDKLHQWDMLTLTPEGRGAATADAPWARGMIDALLARYEEIGGGE